MKSKQSIPNTLLPVMPVTTKAKSSLRSEAALLTRFGNIMYVTGVIITFLFCAMNGVVGDIAECWVLQQFGSASLSFSNWISVIFCLIGGFLGFLTFLVGRIFHFAAETLLHEAKRLHKEG